MADEGLAASLAASVANGLPWNKSPAPEEPIYDPVTGALLTPQYSAPTATPSTQGITLPEKYLRQKFSQAADILTGPGRVMRGELPMTAVDPITGEVHTSPQAIDLASGIAGVSMTGGIGGTGPGGVALGAGPVLRGAAKKAEAVPTTVPAEAARPSTAEQLSGLILPNRQIILPEKPTLFDYRNLDQVPNVSQFDLPRYDPNVGRGRGVSERVQDLMKNQQVYDQMLALMKRGQEMGGATFYGTEPLRKAFIEELGRAKGPESFARYMDYAAGTSPRSKVPENVRNASYYYMLDRQGRPMPAIGDPNPQPYGHMAQRLHQQNANTITGGGFDLFQNPKPPSFSQNLQGNLRPVTVDAHAFKLPAMLSQDPRFLMGSFKPGEGMPTINPAELFRKGKLSMEDALKQPTYWAARPNPNEYMAMEDYYKRMARDYGFPEPALGQASVWTGGGGITGLGSPSGEPFIRAIENRANITADARGISPAEALSRMIRGRQSLLALPPAIAGAVGAVLPGREEEPRS